MAVVKRAKPYQIDAEIEGFAGLLNAEGVRSFLEIGSKFGGSLMSVAKALPVGSRVVSVDFNRNGYELGDCILQLRGMGYQAHLIPGDSTAPETIKKASGLGPYDAVFIDGNHTLAGVTADWNNYGPMARIVAFHDIALKRGGVPELWNVIKAGHRFEEFKLCPAGDEYGIGVLWK